MQEIPEFFYTFINKNVFQSDFTKKFETIKRIGAGSFANVFLIKEKNAKNKYACKTFNKGKIISETHGKKTIWNEIQLLASTTHNFIVKLHYIYDDNLFIYLILDLLVGGSLDTFLKTYKPISEKSVAKVFYKIISALQYLHSHHIIHRDIKPANILFRYKLSEKKEQCFAICLDNQKSCLVDLGLAVRTDTNEDWVYIKCGTYGYLAPEIEKAKHKLDYDTKVDIFSAGCILYYLLKGSPLFNGKTKKELYMLNKAANISLKDEQFSPEATKLLTAMLEKNPKDRISTIEVLGHTFFQKYLYKTQTDFLEPEEIDNSEESPIIALTIQKMKQKSAIFDLTKKNIFIRKTFRQKHQEWFGSISQQIINNPPNDKHKSVVSYQSSQNSMKGDSSIIQRTALFNQNISSSKLSNLNLSEFLENIKNQSCNQLSFLSQITSNKLMDSVGQKIQCYKQLDEIDEDKQSQDKIIQIDDINNKGENLFEISEYSNNRIQQQNTAHFDQF